MKIFNKQAPAAFKITEKMEAGIALLGSEVKAVREGHADLTGAYVKIMGSEAYVINMRIFPYQYARVENYDERRTRKLLLHKKQILALKSKLAQGNLTLVALNIHEKNHLFKVEIGLARGKKQYDKRREIKKKELDRRVERELKNIG